MRSGETDIAETVNATEFEEIARNISSNLKHKALLDVDCFKTDDGKIFVLEMNCRFGGQYPFSHISGVDVPKQIVKWLAGQQTDWDLLHIKTGVVACKEIEPSIISK